MHIPALDGVRGVAILAVFALHYGGGRQSSNMFVHTIGLAVQAGWSGVILFFILSGFLITGILWNSKGNPGWWKNFYIRRLLRIAPLYYLALLIVICGAFWAGNGHFALAHIWVYALYLQNIPPWSRGTTNYGSPFLLSHFWSLAVEEQFYLLWPLLVRRARTIRQVEVLCALLFVGSLLFRLYGIREGMPPGTLVDLLPARMGELALGGFLAMAYMEDWWSILERMAMWVAPVSLVAFALLGVAQRDAGLTSPSEAFSGVALASLFWGSFVVLALGEGYVSRTMSMRWLGWVGSISYGIYVYHVLLAGVFAQAAARIVLQPHSSAAAAVRAALAIAVVFPLSWASYRFFELPIMRLRRSPTKRPIMNRAS